MRRPLDVYTEKQIKNLGKRIRALRKNKFSNYEHFAYENELNRVLYGQHEQGKDLMFSSLIRILQGLGISLSDFFAEGFDDIEARKKED